MQKVQAGMSHEIHLVEDTEAEAAAKLQQQFTKRVQNEYDAKAKMKREKKTGRQTARLQIYDVLDGFAWSELPDSAKELYSELGWHEVICSVFVWPTKLILAFSG